MTLSRREFARFGLAGAVAAVLRPLAFAAAPVDRFAVSTWSFHNYFENTRYGKPEFKPDVWWKVEQVVSVVKEKLGITSLELSSAHLASFEPKYLEEINAFMTKQGAKFIHLSDNMKNVNLGKNADDQKTFEQLIDVAKALRIPSMRVNTGDGKIDDVIPRFKALAAYGEKAGVEIVIENHFGLSAEPKNVAAIIKAVGKNISSCPDFGLLPDDDSHWPGLDAMFATATKMCSAKFHGLDSEGKHAAFDLKRCYDALTTAKFPGYISFEYEGNLEPLAQLQMMKALAEKWLA